MSDSTIHMMYVRGRHAREAEVIGSQPINCLHHVSYISSILYYCKGLNMHFWEEVWILNLNVGYQYRSLGRAS